MAKQTLAPSKTPLYRRYRDYIPYGARRAFLSSLRGVENWADTSATRLMDAFVWSRNPPAAHYWSTWDCYLEEAIRKGLRAKR